MLALNNKMGEWKNLTTPEEIIDYFDKHDFSSRDKWYAFKWFASKEGKEDVFLKFLNPEFFPPEEVVKKFFYNDAVEAFKVYSN